MSNDEKIKRLVAELRDGTDGHGGHPLTFETHARVLDAVWAALRDTTKHGKWTNQALEPGASPEVEETALSAGMDAMRSIAILSTILNELE